MAPGASPLLPQRGLDLTHAHQRAQVLELRADLRHVQAAHVVEVLAQPRRLKHTPFKTLVLLAYMINGMVI